MNGLFARIIAIFTAIAAFFQGIPAFVNGTRFVIDTSDEMFTVAAMTDTMNVWSPYSFDEAAAPSNENNLSSFVRYIELMSATGGNEDWDPFVNPNDSTVKTDYDFSRIIASCRGVLNLAAKPHLILGNVPMKLSSDCIIGGFGVNVRPPDDFNEWYDFLCAYLDALIAEFGKDEVASWRFGVLTEYENVDWFYDGDKDPEASFIAYCKLFDYSVKALTDKLGPDVYVGAHSMTVSEGLWDERRFIEHCGTGTNYATGERGTHISALSSSYYDNTIETPTQGLSPVECIELLRTAAENAGLMNLEYGFDEGRILCGSRGRDDNQILSRMVGYNIQAAFDAKLYIDLENAGTDYFSSWCYTSDGVMSGFPSNSYHVAERFAVMSGKTAVGVTKKGSQLKNVKTAAFATKDKDTGSLYIMAYNYKQDIDYKTASKTKFTVKAPELSGKTVTVKKYLIDTDSNYFDEWLSYREQYGIGNDCFSWSPDDFIIQNIADSDKAAIYQNEIRANLKNASELKYTEETVTVDGDLILSNVTEPNTVVFYEIIVA